jgi:hypothetical protein
VISDIRFRSFDRALEDVLNSIPAPHNTPPHTAPRPRDLHPNQSNSSTNSTHNTHSAYNTHNTHSAHSQASIMTVQAANDLNLLNSQHLHDEISKKLGRWYVQRHGVRADGNVDEMATLIQVMLHAIGPSLPLSISSLLLSSLPLSHTLSLSLYFIMDDFFLFI